MKRKISAVLILSSALMFSGCARIPFVSEMPKVSKKVIVGAAAGIVSVVSYLSSSFHLSKKKVKNKAKKETAVKPNGSFELDAK